MGSFINRQLRYYEFKSKQTENIIYENFITLQKKNMNLQNNLLRVRFLKYFTNKGRVGKKIFKVIFLSMHDQSPTNN
jgi:hypothetical protein